MHPTPRRGERRPRSERRLARQRPLGAAVGHARARPGAAGRAHRARGGRGLGSGDGTPENLKPFTLTLQL